MQKSTMLKKEVAQQARKWYVVDATDLVLGRLSVQLADILRGKNKPTWTPNVDSGDFVIVTNAQNVRLTSNKAEREIWYNSSHYIGGLRARTGAEMLAKYPTELIYRSVKGMLPQNRLSRQIIKKLYIYQGANHPHVAQAPQELNLKKA